MIQLLLNLFGVKAAGIQRLSGVSIYFQNRGAIGWVILFALLLGALSWWTYAHTERKLTQAKRRLLTTLRTSLFLLILIALLRPVLSFTLEGGVKKMLVLLLDTSASMKIQDPRRSDDDIKRAAIGKGTIENLSQSLDDKHRAEVQLISRNDLLKDTLQNQSLKLLPGLRAFCDVSALGFGQSVMPLTVTGTGGGDAKSAAAPDEWVKTISASSPQTAIGDAIREVLSNKRGQPLAGIFLATDGANNVGSPPIEAATFAGQENVPLYIYGVGILSPRDIIVGNLFAQDVVFIKDQAQATVRVRGQGMSGQHALLELKLGGQKVAEKEIVFSGDEEMVVPLNFLPQSTGEFDLTAEIAPQDDEAVKDNNSVTQRIRVTDSKIKVLLVEQSPRWEFRYLMAILARDRRVDLKCVLFEADQTQEDDEHSPFLREFPADKDALLKYDLLILGDVDVKYFSPVQQGLVSDFVSKFGGACIFVAGKKFNPATYRKTVFENMLPVEVSASFSDVSQSAGTKPVHLELTMQGRSNPMFRLSPKEEENMAIWKKFPSIYWESRVGRAKPGAQVLMVDSDPVKETRTGKMPVIASQQFGLGQTLYIGIDGLWRWRMNTGAQYHSLFWSQIVQKMALVKLIGGAKKTQLTVDKQQYTVGERVNIYARIYNENFEPVKDQNVDGIYTISSGADKSAAQSDKQDLQLRSVADQPGMFNGDFVATTPGNYKFNVKSDPKTVIDFAVVQPSFELGETAMNEAGLKEMASASGGLFFREEDLGEAVQKIRKHAESVAAGAMDSKGKSAGKMGKGEGIGTVVDAELWSSPAYFILILAIGATEWILRKRSELK